MGKRNVIVIGGGASGLMAAIQAAREGANVLLLEHNDRVGKKLSATGNGRCNLSNTDQNPAAYRSSVQDFPKAALNLFSVEETCSFFKGIGLSIRDREGYLYPRSNQASSVVEILAGEARRLKIKIKTREQVTEIHAGKAGFQVRTETWTYEGDRVILTTGSCASSVSGADSSGYGLAEKLGHTVIRPLPALVPLRCRGKHFSKWAGVRTEGTVTLLLDGKAAAAETGELQLTEYGVSGIPVFQVSRWAVRALQEGRKVSLRLNFLPEMESSRIRQFMEKRREQFPWQSEKELLTGLFPEKLIRVLLQEKDLVQAVSAYELEVQGALSMESAQVCSGGISVQEVNPVTLESLLVPGLFLAGELLDVDGACGGYNLQWAWTSGALAGRCAAKEDV